MLKFPKDWELIDKIDFLQRKIILNSIMYYVYNTNYISDHHYDDCCKQLVELQNEYGPRFVSDSSYGYVYYDFDGSTGYHLFNRLDKKDKDYLEYICTWKLLQR